MRCLARTIMRPIDVMTLVRRDTQRNRNSGLSAFARFFDAFPESRSVIMPDAQQSRGLPGLIRAANPPGAASARICDDHELADRFLAGRLRRMGDAAMIGSLDDAVPSIDPQAWIAPGAVVVGAVRIGPRASVWYGSVHQGRRGRDRRRRRLQHPGPLLPARRSRASRPCSRNGSRVGHHATVHGAYVEAGALIGMGAVLLGGARIGARSLDRRRHGRAGLARRFRPACSYAGVPGRVVRDLTGEDFQRFDRTPERYAAPGRQAPGGALELWPAGLTGTRPDLHGGAWSR